MGEDNRRESDKTVIQTMPRSDTEKRKSKFLEALEHSLGVVTTASRSSGVPRKTFYMWLEKDKEFKAAVDDIREVAIDFVESKLFQQVNNDDTTAMIFYLKTKAKHRGYIERSEIDHDFSQTTLHLIQANESDQGYQGTIEGPDVENAEPVSDQGSGINTRESENGTHEAERSTVALHAEPDGQDNHPEVQEAGVYNITDHPAVGQSNQHA